MLNTSVNSTKTYFKENELKSGKARKKIIPIENNCGKPCELKKNDIITIVRTNGKKDECIYYGECIKYKEFGHWYYTTCVHNPDDYCNVYTDKGNIKYLEVLPLNKHENTHISEEKIEKIIRECGSSMRMNDIPRVKYNHDFEGEYSYVLCTEYGTDGLTPTLLNCSGGCVSSSGGSACGGYFGDEKIPNTNLHIVTCANGLECMKEEEILGGCSYDRERN